MFDIQPLESRMLFAAAPGATLIDGVLKIQGISNRSNAIVVTTTDPNTVSVNFNGTIAAFPLPQITRIEINGGKKNDKVTLSETAGPLNTGIKISTGDGADNITGDLTAIKVVGGAGNDKITGSAGDDTIAGESGNDSIHGGDGDDYIQAGSGNDTVYGDAGHDDMYGSDGNDKIYGGEGYDTLDGGSGNDRLQDDNSDDRENDFYGGRGDDRFYIGRHDNIHDYQFFEDVYVDGHHEHDLHDLF